VLSLFRRGDQVPLDKSNASHRIANKKRSSPWAGQSSVHPGAQFVVERLEKLEKGRAFTRKGYDAGVRPCGFLGERTMETEKRKRGRPRQAKDTTQFWQFVRAARVMCAYDQARERGDKHSVAVRGAVDLLKQANPEVPISQTEVKRILAAWRPRNAGTILRFERKILTEEDMKRHCWLREELAALQAKKGLRLEVPTDHELTGLTVSLTARFAERPNYPRHNRRIR